MTELKYLDIYLDSQGNVVNTDFHNGIVTQYSNIFIVRVLTHSVDINTIGLNILQPNGITLPQKQMIRQSTSYDGYIAYHYRLNQLDTSIAGGSYSELEATLYITYNNDIITTDPIYIGIEEAIDSEVVIGDNTSLTNLANELNILQGTLGGLESDFTQLIQLEGIQGEQGESATVSVGLTTTGLPGESAVVSNVGNINDAILNFTIPTGEPGPIGEPGIQGRPGDTGESATITIGTVTAGNAGTNPIVSNTGTAVDAIFNFTIPKGDTGDTADIYELDDLVDVEVANPVTGEVLKYDGLKWYNATDTGSPGTGDVASVNGYTGTVVLTASDVGAAPVVGGKIPSGYIPQIALTSINVVTSQLDQDDLVVEEGDVAIRSDLGMSFIYDGTE